MRRLLVLVLAVPVLALAQAGPPSSIAGDWVFRMEGDPTPQRVALTADGDLVRGRVYGSPFEGTMTGAMLAFDVSGYAWSGTQDGDRLEGWIVSDGDSSRWSGDRFRAPASPRTFEVTPTTYHRLVGSNAEPALRIYAGDTVRTTTVDAAGWSTGGYREPGNRVTRGGNPLTGPFVVEGTLPGDVLAVTLHRVRLNRDWAYSGDAILSSVLDPQALADREVGGTLVQWVLDLDAGVARLAEPLPTLGAYETPLTPFLGSIAVAPGGGVTPSSRDSGPYGGNMELSAVREGATVYLPVGEEGAFLYLGDGHAAQGDGELTGDALETSLDVTFSVEVLRYRFYQVPRVETEDALVSVGIAGSLDRAVEQATSDLVRWLGEAYGLTDTETALVMGTALRYDIPDLVQPWISVSARIDKAALAGIGD